MGKKILVTVLFILALSVFLLPQNASASFSGDTGALCMDSLYFKDRGFDSASALLASAKDISSDSFVLVFYSRYNEYCRELIPQIQKWADSNRFPVFGIDQYNKYTREYGYFNTKTSFEGWEEYVDRQSFNFPAVFVYNADTRKMTASDEVLSLSAFYNLLNTAGMLGDAYHDYAAAGSSSMLLSQLSLLQGTGSGFDLLRSPTRAESLTMLIRLLGKEEEALIADLSHPFTDVPLWASPYVGYAYNYGITQGVSATAFGSGTPVTSAEFLTFVLRALGYTSGTGGDFEWDSPYALAYSAGILPAGVNTKEFLRADMTVICLSALSASLKGQDVTLAEKLVSQRALDAAVLKDTLNVTVSVPSARQELESSSWLAAIEIEKRSPRYVLEAIHAAVYQRPTVIRLHLSDGSAINWAVHIAENLSFPSEIVASYEMQISGSDVFIIPEYTFEYGVYAALTLTGYGAASNEAVTANVIRANLGSMVASGAEVWLSEYFANVVIVDDSETEYSNADAALVLKRCTASALSKAQWLVKTVCENAGKIK